MVPGGFEAGGLLRGLGGMGGEQSSSSALQLKLLESLQADD